MTDELREIPNFPKGWVPRKLHVSEKWPRDGLVIAERQPRSDPMSTRTDFVVWNCNMVEGGCSSGRYYYTYEAALSRFAQVKGTMS